MAEAHTIPDDTAAHYARLISEAESMRQAGADALKSAYADLRSDLKQLGWAGSSISAEVAAFKGAIAEMALDEKEKNKREEKSDRVDDYVSLLTRARARGERKNDERFDPLTGEFVDDETEEDDAPRSDAGLDIVTKHTEIASEGEPESPSTENVNPRDSGGSGANEGGEDVDGGAVRAGHSDQEELEPSGPDVNGHPNTPEEANEMDREDMRVDEVGHSLPAEKGREAIPAGPEGVDLTHAEAGESPAPSFLTKPPSPLRPNCQRPEMCAGVGRTHCHTCTKAMREQEEFA